MPIRVPTQTIILQRNGQNHTPKIGVAFDFTEDEIKNLQSLAPDAIRKPTNTKRPRSRASPIRQPPPSPHARVRARPTTTKACKPCLTLQH